MDTVEQFWKLLTQVNRFSYRVECGPRSLTGWQGNAIGVVTSEVDVSQRWIHFYEQCNFVMDETQQKFDFKNQYRWILLENSALIRLEHWRRGSPVHLVDLAVADHHSLKETTCHLCGADRYRLEIQLLDNAFRAIWRINGPKKEEMLDYTYSCARS